MPTACEAAVRCSGLRALQVRVGKVSQNFVALDNQEKFMKLTRILIALCLFPGISLARPLVTVMDGAQIAKECDAVLGAAQQAVKKMEARAKSGSIFDAWNRLQIAVEDVAGPVYLLANVHTDKAARDAGDACVLKFTKFNTDLFQDEKLFKRVQGAKTANAHQAMLKKDLLEGFEDTGVALPPEKRKRAKEIIDRLEDLRQEFDRNVRDDKTKVIMAPYEMKGMPEAYIAVQKQDEKGNYVLGLDYPAYFPFVTNASNEEARKRYMTAKLRQGGEPNLAVLDEIMGLRLELAKLYDLPSYSAYTIRRKMAETPEKVLTFLGEVKSAVTELEKKEIEEMRALKAQETGKPLAETRLNRWDSAYYQEKTKKARYN